jgi:hypothetical protein
VKVGSSFSFHKATSRGILAEYDSLNSHMQLPSKDSLLPELVLQGIDAHFTAMLKLLGFPLVLLH